MGTYYYGYKITPSSSLAHYGVLGMKWGVRRYQNSDGTLTAEGKKRAKAEYKADNREAFEIGRQATIAANAHHTAQNKARKAENRYDKNPSERNRQKLEMRKDLEEEWRETSSVLSKRAEQHCQELISKYGDSAVSRVNRDKRGNVHEEIHPISTYVASMLATVGSMSLFMAGISPIGVVSVPKSASQMGRSAYRRSAAYYKANQRNK